MGSYTELSKPVDKAVKNETYRQQLWYFAKGIKQGLPIAGVFPQCLAYGVMALALVSPKQTILISVLVFSGAGQFMAVIYCRGAPPLAIITANLVVNSDIL